MVPSYPYAHQPLSPQLPPPLSTQDKGGRKKGGGKGGKGRSLPAIKKKK